MMSTLPFILLSVLINTIAQVLLKLGMDRIGTFQLHWETFWPLVLKVSLNPFILLGMFCYVASVGSWLIVLSRADVSYAYPLVSLGYIFTALVGYFWLGEILSLTRVTGIFVILIGVFLITRS